MGSLSGLIGCLAWTFDCFGLVEYLVANGGVMNGWPACFIIKSFSKFMEYGVGFFIIWFNLPSS